MEQISSNLSVLVRDSCGKAALLRPSPACPTDQPSLPFTVPKRCKTDEKSTGRVSTVGISVLPWTCSCVLSAGQRFALEKEAELRRAGKGLVILPDEWHRLCQIKHA